MRARDAARDANHHIIHEVRKGNIRQLFPEELNFSISFNGSPIANFVDIVARDMAEALAPLPALACTSGRMQSDADQKRAEIKNRIGDDYWAHSKLEIQMLRGADRYISYGFLPAMVEPDVKAKKPFLQLFDPRNSYYELNRFGQCTVFAHRWLKSVDELCAMFPEWASIIKHDPKKASRQYPDGEPEQGHTLFEMVLWADDKNVSLLLPARNGLVLSMYAHKLSRTPVVIAERPGEDDSPRGQFDDVVWVQVARAIMSTLALEAASIAVQAPIAAPDDMDEFPVGPHAILQSSRAQEIHKVNLELPPTIFAEGQVLDQELKLGSRYPDARTGGVQASVITGKGVEALLGTFDTQIKGAQMVFRQMLQDATSVMFEMDEVWWPNESKVINGTLAGTSWEYTYVPSRDINGRWNCTVTYGFAAGMHPSQSVVTMLQLEGVGAISKETVQENLPFGIDTVQEQRKISVEGLREAMKQGLFAYIQSSGQMAANGQDPSQIIQLGVNAVKFIQDGKSVEDAIGMAFDEQAKAQQAAQAAQQAAAAGGPGGPGGGGEGDGGLPPGVAPGQAGLPPGGLPSIENLVAGFRGNASLPINQATVQRRIPIG